MKNKYLGIVGSIILLLTVINSCEHKPKELILPGKNNDTTVIIPNPTSNCDPDTVYFQNTILPIILTNCNDSGCHASKNHKQGVVILDNYTNIKKNKGDILEKITDNNPGDVMPPPPRKKLDAATIAKIQKWISQGALNNYCNNGCDSTKFAYAADLKSIISNNCGGTFNTCHFTGSASTHLNSYTDLRALGESKKLMGALNHILPYKFMPGDNLKLSSCDINKFQKWINNGYPQ